MDPMADSEVSWEETPLGVVPEDTAPIWTGSESDPLEDGAEFSELEAGGMRAAGARRAIAHMFSIISFTSRSSSNASKMETI